MTVSPWSLAKQRGRGRKTHLHAINLMTAAVGFTPTLAGELKFGAAVAHRWSDSGEDSHRFD